MPSTMTVASTAYITMSLLVVALNTAHARCGGDRRREWRRQAVRGSPEPGPGRCAPPGPGRGRSWCRYWRLVCRCGPAGQAGKRGCGVVHHEVRLEPGAYRPHEPVQFVRGHSGLSAVRALDHVGMHPQTAAVEELREGGASPGRCGDHAAGEGDPGGRGSGEEVVDHVRSPPRQAAAVRYRSYEPADAAPARGDTSGSSGGRGGVSYRVHRDRVGRPAPTRACPVDLDGGTGLTGLRG